MQLCLIRHAIAVERDEFEGLDARRPLTADGRRRMREAATGLGTLFRPELILTSPLLRAQQTAEIVAKACDAPIRVLDALGTGEHREVLAECAGLGKSQVALVGHEPWMGELLSLILTGSERGMLVVFKKGAAALVDVESPGRGLGHLEWMLQPGTLRALGG
ncbi:MAG: histidine phosphatase family protein [Dehalococcoidia bacterium]